MYSSSELPEPPDRSCGAIILIRGNLTVELSDVGMEFSESVEFPEMSESLEIPDMSELLESLEIPDMSELSESLEIPDMSELSEPLEIPDVSELLSMINSGSGDMAGTSPIDGETFILNECWPLLCG